jgi:hypothetical protein
MTTANARAIVALLTVIAVGGCARSAAHADEAAVLTAQNELLRFDNDGRDRLDVYLVGETRSWRIGRLEPGQRRWLTVPRGIPATDLARLNLVVLANATVSPDPLRDPRAVSAIRQPLGALSGQRWTFWQGQLKSERMDSGRVP